MERFKQPKCFTPEEDIPYPLCIGSKTGKGQDGYKCIECNLFIDYPGPYDYMYDGKLD